MSNVLNLKEETTPCTLLRMQFLWKAAHIVFNFSPQLSSFYLSKFDSLSLDADFELAPSLRNKFCSYCFVPFVVGRSYSVSVRKISSLSNRERASLNCNLSRLQSFHRGHQSYVGTSRKHFRNVVCFKCKLCQHTTVLPGSEKKRLLERKEMPEVPKEIPHFPILSNLNSKKERSISVHSSPATNNMSTKTKRKRMQSNRKRSLKSLLLQEGNTSGNVNRKNLPLSSLLSLFGTFEN